MSCVFVYLFVCLYTIINSHLRIYYNYTLNGSVADWRLFDNRMHFGQWLVAGLQTWWYTDWHLGHFHTLSTWNGNRTGFSLQI